MGYTGFTLVMPFLPLFIGQLGVTDVGEIAMWTGVSLGVTPALTALLAPAWGRLGDRFGRKIMVERSLVSFVVLFAAMAFVTRAVARAGAARDAGAVRRLRIAVGGDGGRVGAARSHAVRRSARCRPRSGSGPAVGPVIGGVLAGARRPAPRVPRDRAVLRGRPGRSCTSMYDDRATHAPAGRRRPRPDA